MGDKEDLGLSLSLSSAAATDQSRHSLQLNLMPFMQHKSSWNDGFAASGADRHPEMYRAETRSFLRGIDVNKMPSTTGDCEDEAGVSSLKSTISTVSEKRLSERDAINGEESKIERVCSRGISDEEDGDKSRKKLRLSKDQSAILEESSKEHNTLNPFHEVFAYLHLIRLIWLSKNGTNGHRRQIKRRHFVTESNYV